MADTALGWRPRAGGRVSSGAVAGREGGRERVVRGRERADTGQARPGTAEGVEGGCGAAWLDRGWRVGALGALGW